jgi:hypothetical protein
MDEHLYVVPKASQYVLIILTIRNFIGSSQNLFILKRVCECNLTYTEITNAKVYVKWRSALAQLTTDECRYSMLKDLNWNWPWLFQ